MWLMNYFVVISRLKEQNGRKNLSITEIWSRGQRVVSIREKPKLGGNVPFFFFDRYDFWHVEYWNKGKHKCSVSRV